MYSEVTQSSLLCLLAIMNETFAACQRLNKGLFAVGIAILPIDTLVRRCALKHKQCTNNSQYCDSGS